MFDLEKYMTSSFKNNIFGTMIFIEWLLYLLLQNGFTPLHLATQEGHTDMVSLLLEQKGDVNFKAKVELIVLTWLIYPTYRIKCEFIRSDLYNTLLLFVFLFKSSVWKYLSYSNI